MFGSGAFHHYDPFFGEDAASLGIDDAGIVGRVPPAPAAALQMTFGQYGGGLDDCQLCCVAASPSKVSNQPPLVLPVSWAGPLCLTCYSVWSLLFRACSSEVATGLPEPFVHHHPGGIDLDDDQAAALVPLDLKCGLLDAAELREIPLVVFFCLS